MRGVRLLLLIAAAMLVTAASAWADGPVGSDPAQNFPMGTMPAACNTQPDGAECQNAAIYYLDQARASLGQPAYALPADFTSLSPVDRDLILTDLDRALYGLPPIPGRTAALDADAANGVTVDDDPRSSDPHFQDYTSNWAGAFENIEAAYEAWMYDDGPGADNLSCQPSNMTGCWGHRHDILWSFGGSGALAMGAAASLDRSGAQGYAMLVGMGDSSYSPTYTDTWAAAQADGAGRNTYNPGTPQTTVEVVIVGDPGTVTDTHGQVCTSGTCDFAEPVGQLVTLTATAPPGYVLSEWLGACSGAGACTFTPEQGKTLIGAYFLPSGSSASSGSLGPASPHPTPGPTGGKTGTARVVTPPRISRLTTSPATIHVTLHGSHLTCTLSRRVGRRWMRVRVAHCGVSVTYRHLPPGRYRLTVASGRASVSRTLTLRARRR